MQKISTCLWFDGQAEEAARFYCSVFRNSKIRQTVLYGDTGPGPKGSVMTVHFELDRHEFLALNAGPMFKFNHAISLMVNCETQKELDEMWTRLSVGGATEQCGWLRDKYGLSWQVVPAILADLLKDPAKSDKVMQAVIKMTKLDIATMRKAAS